MQKTKSIKQLALIFSFGFSLFHYINMCVSVGKYDDRFGFFFIQHYFESAFAFCINLFRCNFGKMDEAATENFL